MYWTYNLKNINLPTPQKAISEKTSRDVKPTETNQAAAYPKATTQLKNLPLQCVCWRTVVREEWADDLGESFPVKTITLSSFF